MRTYIVQESRKITQTTLLLRLEREEHERPLSFQPGQYAAINFQHGSKLSATRCFSLITPPTEQDIVEFSMRIRGRYTTALSKLQPGDTVNLAGPFGGFVFDASRDKAAVFIAGGIGITPFMSMLRYLARLQADNHVTLLYSCPTQDDIPFGDELQTIQKQHPNLQTVFVIGKGPVDKLPAAHVVTGYISAGTLDTFTGQNYTDQRFFICGSPPFMKAMSDIVKKKGVPKHHLLTEAFTQSSPKQTSILRSWPANVYVLGAVGVVLGSLIVMVSDLLKSLPPTTTLKPTQTTPFLVTSARQKQLDQLVNTIPPSPIVITAPTANQAPPASTASPGPTPASPSPVPIFTAPAPVYIAPAPPRTTASAP